MTKNYQFEISDEQSHLAVSGEVLTQVMRTVLRAENVAAAEISLALVDDTTIHRVNRDYLDHDEPTDVISFLLDETRPEHRADESDLRGAGKRLDGEIVVSVETAVRVSGQVGWSATAEVVLYVVHGLLHLIGYDDLTDEERPLMRQRERDMLQACSPVWPELAAGPPGWSLQPDSSPQACPDPIADG